MPDRIQIKEIAKKRFYSHYWPSVGVVVLFALIYGAGASVTWFAGGLGYLFLMPLEVGVCSFMISVYRGNKENVGKIFTDGFTGYARKLGGMLWMYLFTFLWSLLFVVPGIIKAFSYFMTPYILAEYPNVEATEALKLSMRMTNGYKGTIFVMYLSFIGWQILSGLTFGVLEILYVGPYQYLALAGQYEALKNNALEKGVVQLEELTK